MNFEGAVIQEQGVKFAVVVVKSHVTQSPLETDQAIREFGSAFSGLPVVLMSQNSSGRPLYVGRKDLVNFLANVPFNRIPWRKFTLN